MKREIEKIAKIDNIEYYLFRPTIIKQYYSCYSRDEKPFYFDRLIHKVRMFILKIVGDYRIYYMFEEDKVLGHIVVSRGGNRIELSNKEDIVIGPIWICPKNRNNGIGKKSLETIANKLENEYRYAYEYIEEGNEASIKIAEKNNFTYICRAKEYGLLKTIKENKNGNLLIYKYIRRI